MQEYSHQIWYVFTKGDNSWQLEDYGMPNAYLLNNGLPIMSFCYVVEHSVCIFSMVMVCYLHFYRDVKDLIRAGCNNPVFCSVHEHSKTCTPKGLQQSYVLCNTQDKFMFLWSFIRHHRKHKILVFLATCKQVNIVFKMKNQTGVAVMSLWGVTGFNPYLLEVFLVSSLRMAAADRK